MKINVLDRKEVGKLPPITGPDQSISDWHYQQAMNAEVEQRPLDAERHYAISNVTHVA